MISPMSLFSLRASSLWMGAVVCLGVLSGEVLAEATSEEGKSPVECPARGLGPGSGHRGAGPGGPRMRGPGSEMEHQWKKMDTDEDGFLSFEEFSKSPRLVRLNESKRRKLFDYLDRNKDGKLSMRELRPSAPGWMMALRKEFKRLDTDRSRGLSYEQFSQSSKLAKMSDDERTRIFKHLDRNRDGEIQLAELSGGKHRGGPEIELEKYDLNQSGGLSFEEFSKIPWMARIPEKRRKALFQKMDLKQDGEISPREVRRAWVERRKCGPPGQCGPVRKEQRKSPHHPSQKKNRGGEVPRPPSVEEM